MILGVDPGLAHVGWALMSGDQLLEFGAICTKRGGDTGDVQRRLREIAQGLAPVMRAARRIAIEWPSGGMGRDTRAAMHTAAGAGLVFGMALELKADVVTPAPVTWRKALGSEHGEEDAIHALIGKKYVRQLSSLTKERLPHVLDAIGLAIFARGKIWT